MKDATRDLPERKHGPPPSDGPVLIGDVLDELLPAILSRSTAIPDGRKGQKGQTKPLPAEDGVSS